MFLTANLILVSLLASADPIPIASPKIDEKLRDELLARAKQDQSVRMKLIETGSKDEKLLAEVKKVDDGNRAWLKGIVEERGWPGKSMVGVEGSHVAWLMAQHADADLDFQKKCLALMTKALKREEVAKEDWAYLVDRVLIGEKKKQRYGTQLHEMEGKLVPKPIEDEATLDVRRKEVGLMPMAEYLKFATQMYKPKEPSVKK
jgi:hypothetical protein